VSQLPIFHSSNSRFGKALEAGAQEDQGRVSPNSYQDFIRILLLAHLVFSRIFMMASKKLVNHLGYPANSVGKQGEEFLITALVKSYQDS
jgi:hypothetical protein